eukprot:scaffold2060_cov161-Alexandrium_tamarense.AAC.9
MPLSNTKVPRKDDDTDLAEFRAWIAQWNEYQGDDGAHYWRSRFSDIWSRRYNELIAYKFEDLPLGKWVEKMREDYMEGRLDEERVRLLSAEGFNVEQPLSCPWCRPYASTDTYWIHILSENFLSFLLKLGEPLNAHLTLNANN